MFSIVSWHFYRAIILFLSLFSFKCWAYIAIYEPYYDNQTQNWSYKVERWNRFNVLNGEKPLGERIKVEKSSDLDKPLNVESTRAIQEFIHQIFHLELANDFRPNFNSDNLNRVRFKDGLLNPQKVLYAVQVGLDGNIQGAMRAVVDHSPEDPLKREPLPFEQEFSNYLNHVDRSGIEIGRLSTETIEVLKTPLNFSQNRLSVSARLTKALLSHLFLTLNGNHGPVWFASDYVVSKVYQKMGLAPFLDIPARKAHIYNYNISDFLERFVLPFNQEVSLRENYFGIPPAIDPSPGTELFKKRIILARKFCDESIFHFVSDYYFFNSDLYQAVEFAKRAHHCWPGSEFYWSDYVLKFLFANYELLTEDGFKDWLKAETFKLFQQSSQVRSYAQHKLKINEFGFLALFYSLKKKRREFSASFNQYTDFMVDLQESFSSNKNIDFREELRKIDLRNCEALDQGVSSIPLAFKPHFKKIFSLNLHLGNISCFYDFYNSNFP